ncbi:MAG: YeeE/YedE family protein [Dehalococcoidia bacterium]|nr:YeeE/YedE family protein [Dehalococcoidia bacterium]
MNPLIFWGLAVGLVFGFALSRGRFCMNSAFRDIIVLKDYTLLKAVGVAILVSLIGFTIMALAGVITLSPKPFFWGANMVGGFVFGIGMVLAGGCASGISYRAGEGMVGAMSAVLGLTLAGLMTAMGAFKPAAAFLQSTTKITLADGANLTLANVLGVSHYWLAFGIAAVAIILWIVFAIRGKKAEKEEKASLSARIFKRGWGWLSTGIVMGIIGMIAFYSSTAAGRSYPLAITAGWITNLKSLIMGENLLNWLSMMIIGLVLGALIASLIADEFKLRAPSPGTLIQTFCGGLLMGFGAVCSAGCNITHILSGVPQLALSSMLGGAFIILGCWAAAWWMFIRPMRA